MRINAVLASRVRVAFVALTLAVCACGGGEPTGASPSTPIAPVNTPTLSTINVSIGVSTLAVGQSATASAAGLDQNGLAIAVGTVTWASSDSTVATITQTGSVTAVAAGSVNIVATASGKTGQAVLTVTNAIVATVSVAPAVVNVQVGSAQQLVATLRDVGGNVLAGRAVNWASADPTKASVSQTGLVQGIAAGTTTITATSETKTGVATVTVTNGPASPNCTPSSSLQLTAGEIRPLTAGQVASLCIGGGGTTPSEYVLIPFNNSNVAAATTQIELAATNTATVATAPDRAPARDVFAALDQRPAIGAQMEGTFRTRELSDVGGLGSRARVSHGTPTLPSPPTAHAEITGVSANPSVGSVVQLNANLNGNTCTSAKVQHSARVVAVLSHAIVLIDALAPAGGYTDAELTSFATQFDTLGFALDTTNFGAPTDIDSNGRLAIFFTPGINLIPGPTGGVIGGLFAARDLFPASTTGCVGSNEGEIFYLPVPDPNKTINGNYADRAFVSQLVVPTLVHEFQHLINAGRRIYINNASSLEQVWLNEGLSHIAEELLYYKVSTNSPFQNIDAPRLRSSQAQIDAFNIDQSQNIARLATYMGATAATSPFSLVDGLPMRGAIWQFLRYSADQKAGAQSATWRALVNSLATGQTNYNAVFGDIVSNARNWGIAQFADDLGFGVAAQYTNPSWNFRSVYSALSARGVPLATASLAGNASLVLTLDGGGVAYVRFRVGATNAATVIVTSTGRPIPQNIDFVLMRTL